MNLLFPFLLPIILFSENIPFQIGEVLHYQASFAKVNAAVAQLKVVGLDTIENTPVYHVQFSAKTKGVMNYVFPIEDQIDLWIDKKSLLPQRIHSKIKEGKFRKQDDIFIPKDSNYLVSNSDTSTVIVNLFFAGSPLESFNITETFSFKLKLISSLNKY